MRYKYLLLTLLLVACMPVASPQTQVIFSETPVVTELPQKTIRFLALGDSYTIGQGVLEKDRWPVQLSTRLKERGVLTELTIIARTGWTTDNLLFSLSVNPPKGHFDLVSLMIGVNNQYRGWEVEEYRTGFRLLLERAIALTGEKPDRVIVISIPDWEVTPYAERLANTASLYDIDAFNQVNLQESQSYGVQYIDITPISRRVTRDENLLAPDGLHPSGEMYSLWVDVLLPQIIEMIH